ncbi:MAG TPA: NADH-quinone oxidoreductase subunit M, partial [Actinomycetota bacterium]
ALLPASRERLLRAIAIAAAGFPLVPLTVTWARMEGGEIQLVEAFDWIPTLGVGYRVGVDGVSLTLAALTALLFVVSLIFPEDLRGRPSAYFALFLFLETASLGVFLAMDLFLFYVFWDLSLAGMYFVIGGWGHGDRQRSALKFFLYTLAGSLAMLLAILGLYLATEPRTFDMVEIVRQQPVAGTGLRASLIFLGFAIGFAIKAPLVPFHTWLPPAHVDAPAPGSTILAGVLLKMGTYGFIRILMPMLPEAFRAYALALAILGVVSIVYGALVTLAQRNVKRLIAYSSVTHMGYTMLGIAAAGALATGEVEARSLALTGATVEMVAHGLITGGLFLIAGTLWRRGETYDLDALGGLASRAGRATAATVVLAFASLGLPGLAGFVAEFQIFVGTFSVYPWLAGIGLLGVILLAAAFLRMLREAFLGPLPEELRDWTDLDAPETVSLAPLLLLTVVIGIAPAWLLDVIDRTARALLGGG